MTSTSDFIKSMYIDPKKEEDQYLERKTKRKKKKVPKLDVKNVNIYDDDINLNQLKRIEDEERFTTKEDKPTIEVDVNPKLIRSTSAWKTVDRSAASNKQTDNESDDDLDLSEVRNRRKKKSSESDLDLSELRNSRRRKKSSESDLDLSELRSSRRRKKSSESDLDLRRRRRSSDDEHHSKRSNHKRKSRDRSPKLKRHDDPSESRSSRRRQKSSESDLDLRRKRPSDDERSKRTKRKSRDRSPKAVKVKDDLSESRNGRRRKKSSESDLDLRRRRSPDEHQSKKTKSKHKRKSKDKSPKVVKVNEFGLSSEEEDIREKIKNLYKEDGPDIDLGKLKKKQEIDEKYKKWTKGLKQIEDQKKKIEEEEYEMSKPLARYKDDKDLDKHLREQELVEDPMLLYFRKRKKEKEQQMQLEETGEVWEIPKYESKIPPPINRYNIWPGYRWDGIDRSNGFESRLLAARAEKQANEEEMYKMSQVDV